jgi:hypothetical protein
MESAASTLRNRQCAGGAIANPALANLSTFANLPGLLFGIVIALFTAFRSLNGAKPTPQGLAVGYDGR